MNLSFLTAAQAGGTMSMISTFGSLALIILIFYFFMLINNVIVSSVSTSHIIIITARFFIFSISNSSIATINIFITKRFN